MQSGGTEILHARATSCWFEVLMLVGQLEGQPGTPELDWKITQCESRSGPKICDKNRICFFIKVHRKEEVPRVDFIGSRW